MKKHFSTFTIIELLVVITVIAILAAVLLPTFTNARNKAKSIKCVSNQKQAGSAFMMYATDYDGFAYGGPEWGAVMLPEAIVKPYRETNKIKWPNAPAGQGYLQGEEILFCPATIISNLSGAEAYGSALSGLLQGATPFRFTTIGTVKNPDQDSPPLPIPFKYYITPSNSLLGGDSAIIAEPSNNKYTYFSGITNKTDYYHIDMRHKKEANIFMADGHVRTVGNDLSEYYFYNIRGSSYKDEKIRVAIQDENPYSLN
ncbi:MAG: hypothetical protein PHH77_01510 [Victivallaceae bacterium]|nr:hypothetical protein [Victivallaceae bacterium]